ncbi:MAG: MinD/ParA family protein [Chloroflexota bacterium]
MSKIISIHSFRGGTGKSNTTANIAALLAADGRRVGVVDTDIQSPGIHILFGLAGTDIQHSLNDYLWGRCAIEQAAHDVTANLNGPVAGRLFLIPSSMQANEIVNVLREGYDVSLLTSGFRRLIKELNLDVLMIDTHPGLNEETLFSIAISHALAIIMRPDQQDYEGTGVTVEVARSLDVPRMMLIINKTPPAFDPAEVRARVEQAYNCEVAAVLPHSDEMMTLASAGVFAMRYPDHPLTALYKQVTARLVG